MYGDILSKLAGGGAGGPGVGAPPGAAMGVGMGAPPAMPGLPPPPTGVGAMPVGDPSTTKKGAADNAIMSLRELKAHYPSLASMLDATVDAIKGASTTGKPGADKPSAPLGAPQPPGDPTADAPPDAGSPGPA